ncbi:MAG: hypothetical protein NUV56_03300, partial [Candidatus Uhrbacteria bacterium]|nr:hypothetical protein [Candidatus Uhrbacteria bacterium]
YVRKLKEWQAPPQGGMEDDFDFIPLMCGCGSYHLEAIDLGPGACHVSMSYTDSPLDELFDELIFNLNTSTDPAVRYETLRRIDEILSTF